MAPSNFIFHFDDGSHKSLSKERVLTLAESLHIILKKFVLLKNLDTILEFLLFSIKES